MKRGIPEIRTRLYQLAHELDCPELAALADETVRTPPSRRVSPTSTRMTAKLAMEIRAYVAAHPQAAQTQIAARFNVNPGRVSEAMAGKW